MQLIQLLNELELYELVIGISICIFTFILLIKFLISSYSKTSTQTLPKFDVENKKIEELEKVIKTMGEEISSIKSIKLQQFENTQTQFEIDSLKNELKRISEEVSITKKNIEKVSQEYSQLKSKLDEIGNIIRASGLP